MEQNIPTKAAPGAFFWVVALVLGATLGALGEVGLGLACGAFTVWLVGLQRRLENTRTERDVLGAELADLQARLRLLEGRVANLGAPASPELRPGTALGATSASETGARAVAPPAPAELTRPAEPKPQQAAPSPSASAAPTLAAAERATVPREAPQDAVLSAPEPTPLDKAVAAIREFLWGGNTIVRVGALVLMVGVVLLLKWAADNDVFPIEARMAGAALTACGLVFAGYRTLQRQREYALTLQGAGVAALYLTVFFSYKSYGLLPAALTFLLLAAVSVFSCSLAALQNAMSLAIIGSLGGFVAPILASTGEGNHVALFSWYLVLNLTVLAIAVAKLWRPVALVGFAFTFGICSTWGVLRYAPEQFATTEPFLVAFLCIFSAIPVLMRARALKQPEAQKLAGVLRPAGADTTLTFGTPLAGLALQGALLRDDPALMALSLALFGLAHIGVAAWLARRALASFRESVEALLAIGVGLGTLAVPYAIDDHKLTAAGWALEGAGMYWLGVRQGRLRPKWAGVLLQVIAGGILAYGLATVKVPFLAVGAAFETPAPDDYLLTSALLLASCYFIAFYADRKQESAPPRRGLQAAFWGSLAMWSGVGLAAIDDRFEREFLPAAYFAFLGGTGLLLESLSDRLRFQKGRVPALGAFWLLPLAVIVLLSDDTTHPAEPTWLLVWCVLYASMALSARRYLPVAVALTSRQRLLIPFAGCATAALLSIQAFRLAEMSELGDAWCYAASTLVLGAALLLTAAYRDSRGWLFSEYRRELVQTGLRWLTGLVLLTGALQDMASDGDAAPLPFLPLLNPFDAARVFALVACLVALRVFSKEAAPPLRGAWRALLAAAAFFWLNLMLARGVHQWADVPWDAHALWGATSMQWVLSATWTALAVGLMWMSSRKRWRSAWITAATLMGGTVLKLFLVDLDRQSTVARILTFLAVGLSLLVVGYVSPLPPAAKGPAK